MLPSKVIICELTSRRDASFYEEIDVCLFLVKDLREVLYAQVVYPQLTVHRTGSGTNFRWPSDNPCNDFHRCLDTLCRWTIKAYTRSGKERFESLRSCITVARQPRSDYRPETSLQIRRLLCAAQGRIFRDNDTMIRTMMGQ